MWRQAIGNPLADRVVVTHQPVGVVSVQALDASARTRHATERPRALVACWNLRVTLRGVGEVRGLEQCCINLGLSLIDTTSCLESRDGGNIVRIDQPVARRHRSAVMQKRCVAHHARIAIG